MANIGALSIGSLLLSVLALPNASLAAEYTLMPSPQTVHIGHFSAALKPGPWGECSVLRLWQGPSSTLKWGAAGASPDLTWTEP
jgi:hypothetical protein